MNVHLKKTFTFEASHQLPNHDGKCARLHGHSWVLDVWCIAPVNEEAGHPKEGIGIDYYDIKEIVNPIIEKLDHHHLGCGKGHTLLSDPLLHEDGESSVNHFAATRYTLINDVEGMPDRFVPTSENLLIWIAEQLPTHFNWSCLALHETCTSEARLYAVDYAQHNAIVRQQEAAKRLAESDDDIPF